MTHDPVHTPDHYTQTGMYHSICGNPIEVIDVTRAYMFERGNALKYLLRADLKGNTIQDLEKSKEYIELEIKHRLTLGES